MAPEAQAREYLVRITRLPLDAERRELLQAVGRLPADWKSRSVTECDFVYVDAASDEDAALRALHVTRLKVDGGEIIEAAEMDPSAGRARALPPLPSALEGPMPKHRPIPPEEWIGYEPYDYDPSRLPPVYPGRTDGLSGPPPGDQPDP